MKRSLMETKVPTMIVMMFLTGCQMAGFPW
jgi:hypothetical protein